MSRPLTLRHDPRALALLLAASLTVMAAATISPALPGLQKQFPDTAENAYLIRLLVPAPSLAVVLTAARGGRTRHEFSTQWKKISGFFHAMEKKFPRCGKLFAGAAPRRGDPAFEPIRAIRRGSSRGRACGGVRFRRGSICAGGGRRG